MCKPISFYQCGLWSVPVSADQPRRGGVASLPAALHLQTGAHRRRREPGETLEFLRISGHQEHVEARPVAPPGHGGDNRRTRQHWDTADMWRKACKVHDYQRLWAAPERTRTQKTEHRSEEKVMSISRTLCGRQRLENAAFLWLRQCWHQAPVMKSSRAWTRFLSVD